MHKARDLNMRRLAMAAARIFWLVLFLLAGCASTPVNEVNVIERIKSLQPNVVQVKTISKKGESLYGFGFVVGERWCKNAQYVYIVTASHTITGKIAKAINTDFELEAVQVKFFQCQGYGYVKAQELKNSMDEDLDIAILEVDVRGCPNVSHYYRDSSGSLVWQKGRFALPEKGHPVWLIGDAAKRNWDISDNGHINSIDTQNQKINFFIKKVMIGTSGAPLINADGNIVGLITEDRYSTWSGAVSTEIVKYTISDKWELPFDEILSEPPEPPPSSNRCDTETGLVEQDQIKNDFGMCFVRIRRGCFTMGLSEDIADRGQYARPPSRPFIN